MYSIYVSDYTQSTVTPHCLFTNVSSDVKVALTAASLKLVKNEAGSLEITMPPSNVANDYVKTLTSIIEVRKNSQPYWRGRVISEERDSYENRRISCEGTLNFLMDTVQLPMHVHSGILVWLQYLLTTEYHDSEAPEGQYHHCHNYFFNSTEQYKKVAIKYFDPSIELPEAVDWYANYETTHELLKNALEAYDLKMEVSYENGITNLSFYKNYPDQYISDQTITFGKNLINFTRNWEVTDLATVIIPVGSKYDTGAERPTNPYTPPELDAMATIESLNQGSVFLEADSDVIARYGRIYKKIDWNDISEPANLLDLAQNYFQNYQFDKMTIEVELFDLSLLMTGGERAAYELRVLGTVRCVSHAHGLDRYFPITEMDIDFLNPGNTKFVLGEALDTSFTGMTESSNNAVYKAIDVQSTSASEVYNSVESGIDTKIDNKLEPYDTSATIHDWVLSKCYQKSETYTKNQVDSQAAAAAEYYYENNITNDMSTAANTAIEQAKTNAGALINGFGEGGYVIFKQGTTTSQGKTAVNEIIISDILNYTSSSAHVWRWNQNGLGYFPNGYGSGTPNIAITKDGAISADFITTGSMSAARITSGTMSADRIYGGSIASTDVDSGGRHNLTFNLQNGHMFARNLFIETPSTVPVTTAPSDGYIYLATGDWSQNSIWSNGLNTITVGGYTEHNWRCILGSHFGVTSDGVVACNYMKAGNVLVGGDFLRTVTTGTVLGDSGTFLLSGTNSGSLFTTEGTYSVAGVSRSDWRLTVGNKFGVTADGILYSNQGHFTQADVGGTFSTNALNSPNIQYNGRIIYMNGSVTDHTATYYSRTVVIGVRSFGVHNGYPTATIYAFVVPTNDPYSGKLPGGSFRAYYDLGYWDSHIISPWYNIEGLVNYPQTTLLTGSNFHNVVVTDFIDVPDGTTASNPVTKTIQAPNNNKIGVFSVAALMSHDHFASSNSHAMPYYNTNALIQQQGYGWTDQIFTQYTPGGVTYNAILTGSSFAPNQSGSYLLGGAGNLWKYIYASQGTIVTSARQHKSEIRTLSDNFDIFFDRLNPVMFHTDTDDKPALKHAGFILDEVKYALAAANIPKDEFAGYVEYEDGNHLGDGGLRYSEFIAINTQQIQKLKKRVSELEELVEELERNKNENST